MVVFMDLLRVMTVMTDHRRTDNTVHNECIRLEERPIEADRHNIGTI